MEGVKSELPEVEWSKVVPLLLYLLFNLHIIEENNIFSGETPLRPGFGRKINLDVI